MNLDMAGETFLVDHLFAMVTFLRRKRPLLSMRVVRAVPSLMLIEAGVVELTLAIFTQASQFKLGLWGSRTTLLTPARFILMARMAAALHFLSMRSRACQ